MKDWVIVTSIILFLVFIVLFFVISSFYKECGSFLFCEYDSDGNVIHLRHTPPPPYHHQNPPHHHQNPAYHHQNPPHTITPITTSKPIPDSYIASKVPPIQSKDRPTVILEESENHWVDRHGIVRTKAKISVLNDTIEFIGSIDRKSYADFTDAINSHNKRITKLIINSDGGNTKHGKYMGHWIYDNEINVQVRTLCYSSCANYIFPAAANKYIEAGAQVGWHGNILAQSNNISEADAINNYRESVRREIIEELKLENPEEELRKRIEEYKQERKDEVAFYKKIGVDINVSEYFGKGERMSQHEIDRIAALEFLPTTTQEDYRLDGYTFSIENMKHFGIDNVTYLGTDRFPQTPPLRTEGKLFFLERLP